MILASCLLGTTEAASESSVGLARAIAPRQSSKQPPKNEGGCVRRIADKGNSSCQGSYQERNASRPNKTRTLLARAALARAIAMAMAAESRALQEDTREAKWPNRVL
jgi:hypothetical protein